LDNPTFLSNGVKAMATGRDGPPDWRREVHNGFKKPTKEAADLKEELIKRGVKVYVELNDGYKYVDLALPDAKLNVEVDGVHHLTNPHQIVTDLSRG
jgi:very-short-patch-repair endonuclease